MSETILILLLLCVLNVAYISGSEVKRRLIVWKCMGPDEISIFIIQGFLEICAPLLSYIFNLSLL
jgi:hypothetical protein